jgi:hypothetical protein
VLVGGSVQLSVTASDSAGQNLIYSWGTGDCPGAAIVGDDTATPTLSIAAGTSPGLCQVSIEACDACDSASKCSSAIGPVSCLASLFWAYSLSHGFFCCDFYIRLSSLTL